MRVHERTRAHTSTHTFLTQMRVQKRARAPTSTRTRLTHTILIQYTPDNSNIQGTDENGSS